MTRSPRAAVEEAMWILSLVAPMICSLLTGAPSLAEEPASGRLAVRVVETDGAPVGGAAVTVESSAPIAVARSAAATASGHFIFDDLVPGIYRVTAVAAGRAPAALEGVAVLADAENAVTVRLEPAPEPRRPRAQTRGAPLATIPLWRRSAAAAVRLNVGLRARAGARHRYGGGFAAPEWRLDGFDFTHPVTGGPALPLGLDETAGLDVVEGITEDRQGRLWGAGPHASVILRGASNRFEGAASVAGAGPSTAALHAGLSGPVVRDRLWFSLAAEGAQGDDLPDHDRRRAIGKVTWQAGSRNKLGLLAGHAWRSGAPARRASFVGVGWASLPSDILYLDGHLSLLSDAPAGHGASGPLGAVQGNLTAALFWGDRHDTTAGVRGSLVSLAAGSGRGRDARGQAFLQHRWRPLRVVTVAATVAVARASSLGPFPSGAHAVAWDPSADSRTALRARAAAWTVPRLLAPSPPDAVASPSGDRSAVEEAALGGERELFRDLVAGAEVTLRRHRDRLDGETSSEGESLLALHLYNRSGVLRVSLQYLSRLQPAPATELVALLGLRLVRWLSLGALVVHAPRATWAPLFAEDARFLPPAIGEQGGSGWLLGAQLRVDLGAAFGLPAAFWVEALNLGDDRGLVGLTPATDGGAPRELRTPPRQLRLGLRFQL